MTRKTNLWLAIGYILFIFGETILFRKMNSIPLFHLQPFWSYAEWKYYGPQIVANIILFIPLGLLLSKMRWKGILIAVGISILIEVLQLLTKRGVFEFDDIINNTIGALIGYGIGKSYTIARRRAYSKTIDER